MLPELIDRLQNVGVPDRVLDRDICLAEGPHRAPDFYPHGASEHVLEHGPSGDWVIAPHYTSSIDAALTLVPQGWEWTYDSATFDACVSDYSGRFLIDADKELYGSNKNPAIALCIAALRARASQIRG